MNFLSNYLLATLETYEPLKRITSVKTEWTRNKPYQKLYDKVKNLGKMPV